jgi:hypothetical protein
MTHLEILKRISDLEEEANSLGLDVTENKEYKKFTELKGLSNVNSKFYCQDFKLRRSIAGYFVDKNLIHYVTLLEEINEGLVDKVHVIEKKSRPNTEISLEQMEECSDDDTVVYSSMEELDEAISYYLLELEEDGIFRVL